MDCFASLAITVQEPPARQLDISVQHLRIVRRLRRRLDRDRLDGAAAGLGYLIQQAEGVFDVAAVFAGMFVLSAFVILIDVGVTLVERRLLVWRPVVAGRD
jgi:hypothetical protein